MQPGYKVLVLPQVHFALGGPVKPLMLHSVSGKPRDYYRYILRIPYKSWAECYIGFEAIVKRSGYF